MMNPINMLVYDFIEIPRSYGEIREFLLSADPSWMAVHAGDSYGASQELLLKVGLKDDGVVSHDVRLEVGEIHQRGDALVVPIFWVAASAAALFPKLEADLVLAPIDEGTTQLCFQGNYQPPLGVLGRTLDELWLHRLAERTIRHFLEQVARTLAASRTAPNYRNLRTATG